MREPPSLRWNPLRWTLAFFVWLGFAMVAVVGGIFRVVWLEPQLGEFRANLLETIGLALILAGLIWVATPWLVPRLERPSLKILGGFWFGLTIAFEFLFGHFVDGAPWGVLLSNYDVTAGRLWILVPLTMGLGPLLVGVLRRNQELHRSGQTSVSSVAPG